MVLWYSIGRLDLFRQILSEKGTWLVILPHVGECCLFKGNFHRLDLCCNIHNSSLSLMHHEWHRCHMGHMIWVHASCDCNFEQGWHQLCMSNVGEIEVNLYYKDAIQVLPSLFPAPENALDFKLSPTCNRTRNAERTFTTPDTSYWWTVMQKHVSCEGSVLAPLNFHSDQTCLSKNMRVYGYPLVMSLANISCENPWEDAGHTCHPNSRHNNNRFVWCVQVIIFCMLGL